MAETATDPTGIAATEAEVLPVGSAKGTDEKVHAHEAADEEDVQNNGHRGTDGGEGKDSTLALEREKKKDTVKPMAVSTFQLFKYADKLDVFLLIIGTLGAVGAGLAQPLMTVLMGNLINAFGQNANNPQAMMQIVNELVVEFVYLGVASAVAAYLEVTCWVVAGERQSARIRSTYLRAVLRQDVAFFDTGTSTGEVITRMSADMALIQEALGEKFSKFIQLCVTVVGGYTVAFLRSWKLTLVVLSAMPLVVLAGALTAIFFHKTSKVTQAAYSEAGTLVQQVVSSIRTVAAFTGEKKAVQDYERDLLKAEKAGVRQSLITGICFGCTLGIMFCAYGVALWYGSTLVLNDGLTGGQVVNVIIAVLTASMSMSQTSTSLTAIVVGRTTAYKVFQIIERTPPIDVFDTSGLVPDTIKGDVELQKVDFCYPTRPGVFVFSNFSLSIPSGKTVALVGESGSGKSTIVALIERFYDPQAGAVLIDGMDIRTIRLKWLRQQIGLVSQEPVLFSTSIKENIAYGNVNATMEEIEMAATLANASKFITKVPEGYDTKVGDRGVQLSGGQKQRVAIARAILKNPRVLLLDEATSALDAQSERVVQDALDRIMTDRTTIVIAHRLTTIRNADMIAVVERGVIVETGTHNELIQRPNGSYSQLVRLQEVGNEKLGKTSVNLDPDYIPATADEITILRRDGNFSSQSPMRSGSFQPSLTASPYNLPRNRRLSQENSLEKEKGEKVKGKATMRMADASLVRLAKLNRPELPLFIVGSFAAAGAGMIFPIFSLLVSGVINAFFQPREELEEDVLFWGLMFVCLGVGVGILTPARSCSFGIIGERLIRRVRRLTFKKIIHQEIGWFDQEENSSGAISSHLQTDATAVRSIMGDVLALLVSNLATLVAGLVIAFTASWQLAFVFLAMVPLLVIQGYIQLKWMTSALVNVKGNYEDASQLATNAVSSIRTVASFVAEERICDKYNEMCQGPLKMGIRQGIIAGCALGFANFVLFDTFAVCFYVGGKLVESGTITFQDVFRVFFAISLSTSSIIQTAAMSPDLAKVKIAVNSIFEILDRKSKIDASNMSGTISKSPNGVIEFKDVAFFYPTRPDVQIFQKLSFKVQAGQTLALVGESGSGKSTVVSLIERFYDPQSGMILMDGMDIQKLQLKWLRQQVGLVSQEPVLFDENIDWNIVYGKEGVVTEAEIQTAAKAANAHTFISALPDGYKTRVGERGMQLSGGQKQRVAIARSILKDPKILLLDEATSALDAESEHVVQEALDRIMVHRTTIVIAHRLSTVRNADIIAVVKNGGIVEHGQHSELMAKDGAYASLVRFHAT